MAVGQKNPSKWKKMLAVCRSIGKGSSYLVACRAAGITEMTLWRWRDTDKKFDHLIQKLWDSRVKFVEDAHYKSALEGSVRAQQNFLNNRDNHRWKKTPDVTIIQQNSVSVENNTTTIYEKAPMIVFLENETKKEEKPQESISESRVAEHLQESN